MTQPYPPHIMKLNTPEGFDDWFFEFMGDYTRYEEAYEATERNHINYFGRRMYSDYNSYRVCRDRRLKGRK